MQKRRLKIKAKILINVQFCISVRILQMAAAFTSNGGSPNMHLSEVIHWLASPSKLPFILPYMMKYAFIDIS